MRADHLDAILEAHRQADGFSELAAQLLERRHRDVEERDPKLARSPRSQVGGQ